MHRRLTLIVVALLLVAIFSSGPVSPQAQDEAPLQVVTKLLPPFVMRQGDGFTGFSIQLWEAIAQEAGFDYEYQEVNLVGEQLAAVENNEADVAIAGITITLEREAQLDFTFPYFDAGLQILTRRDQNAGLEQAINSLLSPEFLGFLALVIGLSLIAAHLLWWFERRSHPEQSYRHGIGQALWWSAVTVVGFDDKPPRSVAGRIMALIWMFAGIFIIANLTATLSAGATVRVLRGEINGPEDLRNHRVGTVTGTTAARFLLDNGLAYSEVEDIDTALAQLVSGQFDAVVYDAPVLQYYVISDSEGRTQLAGTVFEPESYGIAVPTGSPNREIINQALLRLQENGTYRQLYTRWFGAGN